MEHGRSGCTVFNEDNIIMLLKQIGYFQMIVQCGSFTEAAAQCHISQSAISQQIHLLEDELGFSLMERKNRRPLLTEAGRYFYNRSLQITEDLDRLCRESRRIAAGQKAVLHLAYLKNYGGSEFMLAVGEFSRRFPGADIEIRSGTHEEIYHWLQNDEADLAMSDQRRAFADDYCNLILAESDCFMEVPSGSPLAGLAHADTEDLRSETCIIVTSAEQKENDEKYYREILGFHGSFCCAENLEQAKMMVLAGKGILPMEGKNCTPALFSALSCVPLYHHGTPLKRRYCAYWKKDNSGYYVESFAEILQECFRTGQPAE